jgi:hypothetical protein
MKTAGLVLLLLFMAAISLAPVARETAGRQNMMATCSKEANEKRSG